MTLQKLLNTIGFIGVQDKLVNFTGCGGSVYELNDLTIRDYPILYCSPTGTHRVEENYTTYQLTIFYIDRLLEDNSNAVDIHSAAVEVLKNIIRAIKNTDGVIGVSDEYSINLFTETEKFKDRCNGAYATVEISVVNDTICEDEYLDTTFKVYYHTIDGESLGKLWTNPWGNAVVVSNTAIEPMEYTHIDGQKYIVNGYLTLTDTPTEIPLLYFSGKGNLDAIYLPDTITKINTQAFRNCGNLTTIGGTASTDNIQVYDISPFYGTQMSRTFVVGSKCRSIGSNLTANMGYAEGDAINVNMTYQEFRNKVQFDCNWLGGSPVKVIKFKDTIAIPTLTFTDIPAVSWEGGNVNIKFDSNILFNMRWELQQDYNVIASGTWCPAQGNSVDVQIPENQSREERNFDIFMYLKNEQEYFTYARIMQEAKEYYIRLTSYPASIDSTSQRVTFLYDTDCDGGCRAALSSSETPNGPWVQVSSESVQLNRNDFYFDINENTGNTNVYYKVEISGSTSSDPSLYIVSDSVSFYQETDGTYFEYITYDSRLVPSTATSFLVEYETNMPTPIPYVLSSVHGTTSGVSNSNSQVIINFPENSGATDVVEYRLMMGGKPLRFYQDLRVYHINFTNYPSEITAEGQFVCFSWYTDIPDEGYLAYWLGSGATREAEPAFVRSGVTHNLNGDCITFSANTGDERYFTLEAYAYLPDGTRPVAYDEIVFKQDGHTEPPVSGDTNSAITSDYAIGNPIKDIDEIVPYGYYVFRWTASGDTFAKLTPPYEQEYVTDRYKYTFTNAHIENGIMSVSDAQRVRIVQAVPMADIPELSGATMYIRDYPNHGDNVYTGPAYLLYDIYNEKYFGYNYLNSIIHFEDASAFAGGQLNQTKASVLCNAFSSSNDGVKVGMRAPFSTISNSFKPRAGNGNGDKVLDGTDQFTNGSRPYNYNTDSNWNAVKVDIIPITEVQ